MRGITLIELLLVLGLMTLLAGMSLQNGLQTFERTLGQADAARTAAIVRHARALTLHTGVREVSATDGILTISGPSASEESYPLFGRGESSLGGHLFFSGWGESGGTGSLIFTMPGIPAWQVTTGTQNTIDILHAL